MNYIVYILLLLLFTACNSITRTTESPSKNSIQQYFIDLPENTFQSQCMKDNFGRYGLDLNQKSDRKKVLEKTFENTDSIMVEKDFILIHVGDDFQEPCEMDLRLIKSQTNYLSFIEHFHGMLWTESNFHIFKYKRGSLVECTEEVMPTITLSDFIKPSYLDQFSQDFINNPYLNYTYINEQTDTLKVTFEPQDHPFFETPGSDSAIKKEEVFLVWKKNRFVKIDE